MTSAATNRRCGTVSSIRALPPSLILFSYCALLLSAPLASVSSIPPSLQTNNLAHTDERVVLPSINLDNSTTATFETINDSTKQENPSAASTESTEKMQKSRIRRRTNVATLNLYLLVKDKFDAHRTEIDNFVFQTLEDFSADKSTTDTSASNNPNSNKRTKPSRTYNYPEFFSALRTLATEGIYGNSYHEELHPYSPGILPETPSVEILRSSDNLSFYVGQEEEDYLGNVGAGNAVEYGIVNICAFLAQAMVEGIQFDACEEWNGMGDDAIGGNTDGDGNPTYGNNLGGVHERYFPVSNACGQFGKVYHQERCEISYLSGSESGVDMTCPFDMTLVIEGTPHPNQDYLQNELGVPPPLQCRPKENGKDYAGYWDGYDGQFVEKVAYPSTLGKVDVRGCCYWGRGALRTNGLCNFGKLNYLLGRGAYLRQRYSRYPTIDFCRNPGAICSESSNTNGSDKVNTKELKYIISLFEWIERIQSYSNSDSKWDYMEQLKLYVDEGFKDSGFIDAVSSVVTRGCDDYYCSTHAIFMMEERRKNFEFLVHDIFGLGSTTQSQPRYDYDHFEKWVQSKRTRIEGTVLVSQNNYVEGLPYFSQSFTFDSFITALRVTARFGVSDGLFFYVGDPVSGERGFRAGVVNLAAFLANAMVESIVYDSCDETYWEISSDGKYPMSNSCGQNSRSYQDETCPAWQSFISCPVEDVMIVEGDVPVMGKPPFFFDGQAPQFQCRPGAEYDVGYWDESTETYVENAPFPNTNGRTDVEGCCWWGRGVLHTRGVCNFGKLNFHLGVRAANENRPSIYPDIDFCSNPEEICTNRNSMEIRWVVGMFEWINRVQDYYDSKSGFDYKNELLKYVDGGMLDDSFVENVNRIFVSGCHTSLCSSTLPTVDMERVTFELQRKMNFKNIMKIIFNEQPSENRPTAKPTPPVPTPEPTPPVPTPNPTSRRPTVSAMTSPSPTVGTQVIENGEPSESQRPTGSPVELSDITQVNKGGEVRIYNKASSISDETLIITRNTTLRIEGNGYVVAPANSTWPALRLSDSAKLIAVSGYVNGSYAERGYEGGGGEAIQLNNGQSTVETASYAEFYDGINVVGGDAPGPDGIGGNAIQVNGFGTEARIYGGNFISGKGGKLDGSSLYVLNSGSVHVYGGNFLGEIEVTRNGIIQFHGCFLQNGTIVYGLFPDESELEITVRTTFGGQIVIIPDGEQECDTAPSSSPTRFPTISPQPTVVPRSSAWMRPLSPYILLIAAALASFFFISIDVTS